MKSCLAFAALFLVGVGLVIAGISHDLMSTGDGLLTEPKPELRGACQARSVGAIYEVSGIAVAFGAIYGAAAWKFFHRKREGERQ